jgi:hypothetical protein
MLGMTRCRYFADVQEGCLPVLDALEVTHSLGYLLKMYTRDSQKKW